MAARPTPWEESYANEVKMTARARGIQLDAADVAAAMAAARKQALTGIEALAAQLEQDARTGEYAGGHWARDVLVDVARRIKGAMH